MASTAATFTTEEKFVEAYTQLGKHINHSFPNKISLNKVNATYETIITNIYSFDLEKSSYYAKYIYNSDELKSYQEYVEKIFEFFTKLIFDNLSKDIPLLEKVFNDINTAFLEATFNTYLYNIEIDISQIQTEIFDLRSVFDLKHQINYEDLIENNFLNLSLENILDISKANNTAKLDAFLTEKEIQNIVNKKLRIEQQKINASFQIVLKTNSGILTLKLRILSPMEKARIFLRIILFLIFVPWLAYYCFILPKSYFIFIVGIIASTYLISPIYSDIRKLFKDVFKTKSNG